jgi:2-methylcitrate dehydratase PrpD
LVNDGKGNATIFTYPLKVAAKDAAFANAVLACGIAQDDTLFTFHPGTVNVPTAIAMAEQEGSSGAELITALVIGYDVMGRIFLGGPNIRQGFRTGSVFGPFGAAAVAGKLLKLSENQLTNALNTAANFASGLGQWGVDGTKERDFFDGLAARNGIIAASLAKEGVAAAENSLEGEKGFYQAFVGTSHAAELAAQDLGKRFLIMEARYKPYPVCGILQIPIRLILELISRYHLNPKEIQEIIVSLSHPDATFPGTDNAGPLKSMIQAVLSAQFCVGAAFLGKPVTSYQFFFNHYDDQEVLGLAKRIRVLGEKDRVKPKIEVVLHNGRQYSMEQDIGEELIPADEPVRAKFNQLSSDIVGQEREAEIVNIVSDLDKVDSIRGLTQKLSY